MKTLIFDWKQKLFRQRAVRLTYELKRTERLSADEIESINWQRRLAILQLAEEHSPFYRQRFAACGMHWQDIRTETDFEKIPILTRTDIQEHSEELLMDHVTHDSMGISSTGGSTGQPLRLYIPKNAPFDAFTIRMLTWWQIHIAENSAYVFRRNPQGLAKLRNQLMWFPTRRAFLNAGAMSEESMSSFVGKVWKIRPVLLCGYVGALAEFADFLATRGIKMPSELRAVWTTSAPLPEVIRKRLETVFCCPVYTQYGCCETAHLATECQRKQGMHIHADYRHLEFVDNKGLNLPTGKWGSILVTDMLNQGAPLIRYALGDCGRALPARCSCGCNLPLMDYVRGRETENFRLPDGGSISGDFLTTIFDDFPEAVRGFQVCQKKDYSIQVHYVLSDSVNAPAEIETIHRRMLATSRNLVKVEMIAAKKLSHDHGKTRYIISEIK